MDDKILLFPDFKLFVRHNASKNYWRIKSALYPFSVKHKSLTKAFNEVEKEIEKIRSLVDFAERKELINSIIKSNLIIEFSGKFYLCIYQVSEISYRIFYISTSSDSNLKLKEGNISSENVLNMLDLISKIKINSNCKSGLDGETHQLKVIHGNNEMSYKWWTGSINDWSGLNEVINEFKIIRNNFE
jgi:hypothetical protein